MHRIVIVLTALLFSRVLCEEFEHDLRKLQAGGGGGALGGSDTSAQRAEKLSDAALFTHEAILKATDGRSISKATTMAAKMTAAATDPTVAHWEAQAMEAKGRRLVGTNIGPYSSDTRGFDSIAATSAAIAKATRTPSMGTAKFATEVGVRTGHMATLRYTPFDMDKAAAVGGRKLLGRKLAAATVGPYFSETTGLDTAMAASNAINKAVLTPSRGTANFATDVGSSTARLATHRPTLGQVDIAAGARRLLSPTGLLSRGGRNTRDGGSQATEERSAKLSISILGTRDAILRATEKGSVTKATAIGTKMTAAATYPSVSLSEEQMMDVKP